MEFISSINVEINKLRFVSEQEMEFNSWSYLFIDMYNIYNVFKNKIYLCW